MDAYARDCYERQAEDLLIRYDCRVVDFLRDEKGIYGIGFIDQSEAVAREIVLPWLNGARDVVGSVLNKIFAISLLLQTSITENNGARVRSCGVAEVLHAGWLRKISVKNA